MRRFVPNEFKSKWKNFALARESPALWPVRKWKKVHAKLVRQGKMTNPFDLAATKQFYKEHVLNKQ